MAVRHALVAVCLSLLSLFTGCQQITAANLKIPKLFNADSGLPAWISSPHCSEAAICAVGSGHFAEHARKDAYKSLAETISVEVDSVGEITSIQDGGFIRDSQKTFLSVAVSDVKLNGARIIRHERFRNADYMLIELSYEDLLTQLRQEIENLTLQLGHTLKINAGHNFDSWWALRRQLAAIKIVARNQDVLEKFGAPRIVEAEELINTYFDRLYASYRARKLRADIAPGIESHHLFKSVVDEQLSSHGIEVTGASFFAGSSSIKLSLHFDGWQVGNEYRSSAKLFVELRSQAGQTLAQFELESNSTSLFDSMDAKESSEQKLLEQLKQIDIIDRFVDANEQ